MINKPDIRLLTTVHFLIGWCPSRPKCEELNDISESLLKLVGETPTSRKIDQLNAVRNKIYGTSEFFPIGWCPHRPKCKELNDISESLLKLVGETPTSRKKVLMQQTVIKFFLSSLSFLFINILQGAIIRKFKIVKTKI